MQNRLFAPLGIVPILRALLVISSLLLAPGVFAQRGPVPQFAPPFTLSIGNITPSGPTPPLEHSQASIPFTLTASVPPSGVKTPKNVLVCTADVQSCTAFPNVIPPQQFTRTFAITLPLVGDPILLVACESVGSAEATHCGQTLASAQKLVPLSAIYSVVVTSITVFHTRARSTDTTWVSILGNTDLSELSKANCRGSQPSLSQCQTVSVGDIQDGVHSMKPPFPAIGDFTVGPYPGSDLKFAFAVWNFGFELVSDWGDLSDAFFDAAVPALSKLPSSQQVNITPALNKHPWQGCDGPTAGTAFRMSGAQLDQLTRATGQSSQTMGRYVVRSQVGCGASSQYSVAFTISRVGWSAP